jgi:hypothetical protein
VPAGGVSHIVGKFLAMARMFLKLHLNWRFHKKLSTSKMAGILILKISRLPIWEFQEKMAFGCNSHG